MYMYIRVAISTISITDSNSRLARSVKFEVLAMRTRALMHLKHYIYTLP